MYPDPSGVEKLRLAMLDVFAVRIDIVRVFLRRGAVPAMEGYFLKKRRFLPSHEKRENNH